MIVGDRMPELVPCRGCGSVDRSGSAHVFGERKCCPDCDHRPVLWHFTCRHAEQFIAADGFLLPQPQPILGTDAWLVWATDLADPPGGPLGGALGMVADDGCGRGQVRVRVLDVATFVPWTTWAREHRVDSTRRWALDMAPGTLPRHWWVSTLPARAQVVLDFPLTDA
jgi:hypothetical protein